MRAKTCSEPVPASGNALAPETKPHSMLLSYAGEVPYSNAQSLTAAPSGSTDAYRAADVRVTEEAASLATAGGMCSTMNVTAVLRPSGLPIELCCVATAVYSPHSS